MRPGNLVEAGGLVNRLKRMLLDNFRRFLGVKAAGLALYVYHRQTNVMTITLQLVIVYTKLQEVFLCPH